jgi:hypothetical protein
VRILTIIAALVTPEGAWMGADSLSSSEMECTITASPKIVRVGKRLIGCAGSWNAGQRFIEHMRANQGLALEDATKTLEHDGDVSGLIIENRRIFFFEGAGVKEAVTWAGVSYAACGTGGPAAAGALFAISFLDLDGPAAVKVALRAAEAHNPYCRRPFRIVKAP